MHTCTVCTYSMKSSHRVCKFNSNPLGQCLSVLVCVRACILCNCWYLIQSLFSKIAESHITYLPFTVSIILSFYLSYCLKPKCPLKCLHYSSSFITAITVCVRVCVRLCVYVHVNDFPQRWDGLIIYISALLHMHLLSVCVGVCVSVQT